MIFVMADIACPHYMSTWSLSRNIEERCLTETPQAIFEKVCLDFQAQLVEMNGQAEHYTCSSTTRRSIPCRAWSTALKVFPVAYSVANALIWRNAIGTMSCGRLPTLPCYFAASCGGAPLSIIKQYVEQQKPRSNGPYIPGLKVRGFTAREW